MREDFFDGDSYVVAMDWVDGNDLATLLGRSRAARSCTVERARLPPPRGRRRSPTFTRRTRPVIHGDVKPANLPAIYALPLFAKSGGLIAYGPDVLDPYRRAAEYIDRILKGEKPADLPVQAPIKYELVVNLKTAKALASKSHRPCSPALTR